MRASIQMVFEGCRSVASEAPVFHDQTFTACNPLQIRIPRHSAAFPKAGVSRIGVLQFEPANYVALTKLSQIT